MATANEEDIARDLAGRIHAGDPTAECALFTHYGPALMCMLRSLSRSRWAAEDIHQETFAIVLSRLRRQPLTIPGMLGHFLHRTARIVLMAQTRKSRRREDHETCDCWLEEVIDPAPGQLVQLLGDERRALVLRSISQVRSERYRQLLHRFYLDEETKDSICAELGLSSSQFNRVIHRARRGFLRAFASELASETTVDAKEVGAAAARRQ